MKLVRFSAALPGTKPDWTQNCWSVSHFRWGCTDWERCLCCKLGTFSHDYIFAPKDKPRCLLEAIKSSKWTPSNPSICKLQAANFVASSQIIPWKRNQSGRGMGLKFSNNFQYLFFGKYLQCTGRMTSLPTVLTFPHCREVIWFLWVKKKSRGQQ